MSAADDVDANPDCPPGFVAHGMAVGIKPSGRPDLALILAPHGATAAAMVTTNLVRAAPVDLTEAHLKASDGRVRAILINAGCANAATGDEGRRRAERTVQATAQRLGCDATEVLVASTGVIGEQLPDDRIVRALPTMVESASADGLGRAAEAIMTTDTRRKIAESVRSVGGERIRVVGIAKGAGMIHPDLRPVVPQAAPHATMIAVLLTDAAVEPADLQRLLAESCDRSFHRITVDGDTSTNDCVFALASGAAGAVDHAILREMFTEVSESLAESIVRDGEGARRLLRVTVTGAASPHDALAVARTVAMSLLVRTAVAGGDPNWGRIAAAAGRSGATFDPRRLRIEADGVVLMVDGTPKSIEPQLRATIFSGEEVHLALDLGAGDASDRFLTCDLTEEYIRINAEYTT